MLRTFECNLATLQYVINHIITKQYTSNGTINNNWRGKGANFRSHCSSMLCKHSLQHKYRYFVRSSTSTFLFSVSLYCLGHNVDHSHNMEANSVPPASESEPCMGTFYTGITVFRSNTVHFLLYSCVYLLSSNLHSYN